MVKNLLTLVFLDTSLQQCPPDHEKLVTIITLCFFKELTFTLPFYFTWCRKCQISL